MRHNVYRGTLKHIDELKMLFLLAYSSFPFQVTPSYNKGMLMHVIIMTKSATSTCTLYIIMAIWGQCMQNDFTQLSMLYRPNNAYFVNILNIAALYTGNLSITRSLGPGNFVCYIRYLVISVVNKQYETKQII